MRRLWGLLAVAIATSAVAQLVNPPPAYNNFEEKEVWQEFKDVDPPGFPLQENLREFDVGPASANRYFIDASTLSVGSDDIVRFVLVVKTSGGATNVSFEGINCRDFTWKLYATGRSDGTWVKSRAARSEWRRYDNNVVNRYHAELSRNFFCPGGDNIATAEEGRQALRFGKHPDVKKREGAP